MKPRTWPDGNDSHPHTTADHARTPALHSDRFLMREQAAQMFGISIGTWRVWETAGKVPCGQWVPIHDRGGRRKLYPLERLQRLLADMASPTPGTVDRHEAARMFGVADRTWSTWEKEGKITCGRLVTVLGQPGQQKVYPLDDLRRLVEEFKQDAEDSKGRLEPYPDPHLPDVVRLPLVSNKHKGLEALIDTADLPLAQGKRWNWSGGRAGGAGASVVIPGGGSLARIIMGVADDPDFAAATTSLWRNCSSASCSSNTSSEATAGPRRLLRRHPRAYRMERSTHGDQIEIGLAGLDVRVCSCGSFAMPPGRRLYATVRTGVPRSTCARFRTTNAVPRRGVAAEAELREQVPRHHPRRAALHGALKLGVKPLRRRLQHLRSRHASAPIFMARSRR